MSFGGYSTGNVELSPSDSESTRFGMSTARLTVGSSALRGTKEYSEILAAVQSAVADTRYILKILRFPSDMLPLLGDLDLRGQRAYPGGSLVYWENTLQRARPQFAGASPSEILPAQRACVAGQVTDVIENSFAGYINHYSANPRIPKNIAVEGYAEWAARTTADANNRLFVSYDDEAIVGVAVVAVTGSLWEIELASMLSSAQRRGLYSKLMSGLLDSASDAQAERVVISTQSHNIAVQRAWSKMGFVPISSVDTVHLLAESEPA